jgi:hypothetical protein
MLLIFIICVKTICLLLYHVVPPKVFVYVLLATIGHLQVVVKTKNLTQIRPIFTLLLSLLVLLKTYGASCTYTYTTQQCDYSIGLTCSLVSTGCNCPTTSVANMCDCQASNLNSLFNF